MSFTFRRMAPWVVEMIAVATGFSSRSLIVLAVGHAIAGSGFYLEMSQRPRWSQPSISPRPFQYLIGVLLWPYMQLRDLRAAREFVTAAGGRFRVQGHRGAERYFWRQAEALAFAQQLAAETENEILPTYVLVFDLLTYERLDGVWTNKTWLVTGSSSEKGIRTEQLSR